MLVCCYSQQLLCYSAFIPLLDSYTSESCAMRLLNPARNLWEINPESLRYLPNLHLFGYITETSAPAR